MATARLPQPVHETDESSPAPDDLEPLRSFLSLHDHEPGDRNGRPPVPASLRWWLTAHGLLPADAEVEDRELVWALRVRSALVAKTRESMGEPRDEDAVATLNDAAERTGLRLCFGCAEDRPVHVETGGVRGAVGALLGAAFLAELDGRWERFRVCGDPGCASVFYDRSKNRSGKWCSMASCGNRAKVRAFRERHAER